MDYVYRMEIGEEPFVKTAATLFQRLCYNYRDQLTAGIICAGWDRKVGAQVMQPFLCMLQLQCISKCFIFSDCHFTVVNFRVVKNSNSCTSNSQLLELLTSLYYNLV